VLAGGGADAGRRLVEIVGDLLIED